MRRLVYFVFVLVVAVSLSACRKKQESLEQMQEPMSMESLSMIPAEGQTAAEAKSQEVKAASIAGPQALTGPSVTTSYKPTVKEIQAALQNAGYYKGVVDGKRGPMTKKAIAEFQKANGLEADGKVGPKTWAALSAYTAPSASPAGKR